MMNCTILIPTYNRPNYLKRILSYYNKYRRNFKIIIADSSSNENKMLNSKNILSMSNNNILYLKYPTNIKPFCEKIPDAIKYINTKYCVNCADDDFILPSSINKSIEFLENNLDYTCVQGKYISFLQIYDKRGNSKFYWYPIYSFSNSIFFSNSEDRLLYQFSNYMHTIYSVHKTVFLKMVFNETNKHTDDDRFGELLPSMLDLIYGKMKILDIFYSARETIIDSAGQTSKKFEDFVRDISYEKKYIKFKNCLAKHLTKKSQLSIDESKKIIDEAMSIYLKKSYPKNFNHILIRKMKNILNILDLPKFVDRDIRMLYRKIFTPIYNLSKSKEINDFIKMIESPNSKYFDDFEKIRKHVLLYAKK